MMRTDRVIPTNRRVIPQLPRPIAPPTQRRPILHHRTRMLHPTRHRVHTRPRRRTGKHRRRGLRRLRLLRDQRRVGSPGVQAEDAVGVAAPAEEGAVGFGCAGVGRSARNALDLRKILFVII